MQSGMLVVISTATETLYQVLKSYFSPRWDFPHIYTSILSYISDPTPLPPKQKKKKRKRKRSVPGVTDFGPMSAGDPDFGIILLAGPSAPERAAGRGEAILP